MLRIFVVILVAVSVVLALIGAFTLLVDPTTAGVLVMAGIMFAIFAQMMQRAVFHIEITERMDKASSANKMMLNEMYGAIKTAQE